MLTISLQRSQGSGNFLPDPIHRPKESPPVVEPLSLDPPRGPKVTQQVMPIYQPDEVIFEESEADERPIISPRQKPPCHKALIKNVIFKNIIGCAYP